MMSSFSISHPLTLVLLSSSGLSLTISPFPPLFIRICLFLHGCVGCVFSCPLKLPPAILTFLQANSKEATTRMKGDIPWNKKMPVDTYSRDRKFDRFYLGSSLSPKSTGKPCSIGQNRDHLYMSLIRTIGRRQALLINAIIA